MYKFIVSLRSMLLVFLTHKMALPVLRIIREPEKFSYSKEDLHRLATGTLGKELVTMLDEKNLQLLPYYARHDIKHILLQYDTTDEGEVCLQCFMLGNKHYSFPVAITVFFGILVMPEHWTKFRIAYKRGARCLPIENWKWFTLLNQPIQLLKDKINENESNPHQ